MRRASRQCLVRLGQPPVTRQRKLPAEPALFDRLEQRRMLSTSLAEPAPPAEPGFTSETVLVDAGAGPEIASTAAQQSDLRVYSWHDWEIDGVVPMVWVRMDSRTPEQAAAETIPTLQSRADGERALLLWHLGDEFTDWSLDRIVREGMNTAPDRIWLTRYFELLDEAGVTPDFIAMDYEDGVSFWHEEKADVQRIMSDPSLRAHLPEALQQYRAEHFEHGQPLWREAVSEWNTWANQVRAQALREVAWEPARAVFVREIDMSNYGDMHPGTQVYDPNGWELDQQTTTTVAGWSSPSLYLSGDNQVYGQLHTPRPDPAWSRFVENLNHVRSVLQTSEKVAPWISYPSYGGDRELWTEHLRQIRASGVDTILLWNPEARYTGHTPEGYEAEKQFTRNAFADVFAISNQRHLLPMLDHKNAVVETAGYSYDRLSGLSRQPAVERPVDTSLQEVHPDDPTTPTPEPQVQRPQVQDEDSEEFWVPVRRPDVLPRPTLPQNPEPVTVTPAPQTTSQANRREPAQSSAAVPLAVQPLVRITPRQHLGEEVLIMQPPADRPLVLANLDLFGGSDNDPFLEHLLSRMQSSVRGRAAA